MSTVSPYLPTPSQAKWAWAACLIWFIDGIILGTIITATVLS